MPDTRENCWSFFINRVRTLLKVRSFTPIGFYTAVIKLYMIHAFVIIPNVISLPGDIVFLSCGRYAASARAQVPISCQLYCDWLVPRLAARSVALRLQTIHSWSGMFTGTNNIYFSEFPFSFSSRKLSYLNIVNNGWFLVIFSLNDYQVLILVIPLKLNLKCVVKNLRFLIKYCAQ